MLNFFGSTPCHIIFQFPAYKIDFFNEINMQYTSSIDVCEKKVEMLA